jgi:hypothetical protein
MKLVMIEHQGFTNIKGRVDARVEVESFHKEDAEWKMSVWQFQVWLLQTLKSDIHG